MKIVAESHKKPEKPKHTQWGPACDADPLRLGGQRVCVYRSRHTYPGTVYYTEDKNDIARCFIRLDCGSSGWFPVEDVEPYEEDMCEEKSPLSSVRESALSIMRSMNATLDDAGSVAVQSLSRTNS